MSTCSRCGRPSKPAKLPPGEHHDENACYADSIVYTDQEVWRVTCLQTELANLRSLLRSVTGKLEEALEELGQEELPNVRACRLIDSALQVLS